MRMLDLSDLREKGIKFSRQHLNRLIKAGKFPAPVKLGARRNAWPDTDIEKWMSGCVKVRDGAAASR
jgi:prophage regulatory protein